MIAGIKDEIDRLNYTIKQCTESNPHKLDIQFMATARALLIMYYNLHNPTNLWKE